MATALLLVGGVGTQLRPLTLSKSKHLVHLGDKLLLQHTVENLVKKANVRHIILAISYPEEILNDFVDMCRTLYQCNIICSRETEPLGTAGPIALAVRTNLLKNDEHFFVINADVACSFDLGALREFHLPHGKVGTIAVTNVDEPAKYGKSVVISNASGVIERFVEHGRKFAGCSINSGVYIFSARIFQYIDERPTSLEREILPQLASEGQLSSMHLDGYWMNVKSPLNFLQGQSLYMDSLRQATLRPNVGASLTSSIEGSIVEGNIMVDPNATVGPGSHIGPDVYIGSGAVLDEGVRLAHCIILPGGHIGAHATVIQSIVGWGANVGRWTRIEGVSLLGEGAEVGPEIWLNGVSILPRDIISESVN